MFNVGDKVRFTAKEARSGGTGISVYEITEVAEVFTSATESVQMCKRKVGRGDVWSYPWNLSSNFELYVEPKKKYEIVRVVEAVSVEDALAQNHYNKGMYEAREIK